jgi:putative oxidoreductase
MKRTLKQQDSSITAPSAPVCCHWLDKTVLRQAWDLFIFSAVFGLLFNVFYSNGIKIEFKSSQQKKVQIKPQTSESSYAGWNVEKPKATAIRPTPTPVPSAGGEIQRIGLEGAKSRFDEKSCVFIDARPLEKYLEGHIPGALNCYAEEFDKLAPQFLPQLPDKNKEIIAYCHGTDCELSNLLAQGLVDSGYTNVKVFFGGWPHWKDAGYPIAKGPNPFDSKGGAPAEKKSAEEKPKSLAQILFSDICLNLISTLLLALWLGAWAASRSENGVLDLDWKAMAATLIRVFCGFILVYASLDKLGNSSQFSESVGNYQILPSALIPLAAVVVPWFEFITGLCLTFGFRQKGASLIFCVLMAGYAVSIGSALLRGIDLNCGCFNMDWKETETGWTVLRDVLLFLLGTIVLVSSRTYARLDQLFCNKNSRS